MAHKVRNLVSVSAGTPGIDLFLVSLLWCNDDDDIPGMVAAVMDLRAGKHVKGRVGDTRTLGSSVKWSGGCCPELWLCRLAESSYLLKDPGRTSLGMRLGQRLSMSSRRCFSASRAAILCASASRTSSYNA